MNGTSPVNSNDKAIMTNVASPIIDAPKLRNQNNFPFNKIFHFETAYALRKALLTIAIKLETTTRGRLLKI